MQCILIKPDQRPIKVDIPSDADFSLFQTFVGGYVETLRIGADALLMFDEEGKLKEKKKTSLTIYVNGYEYELVGNVLVVGLDGDKFVDVPERFYDLFHMNE